MISSRPFGTISAICSFQFALLISLQKANENLRKFLHCIAENCIFSEWNTLVMPQDCRCKMRNNAKAIGRSKIKPHEGILTGAGGLDLLV